MSHQYNVAEGQFCYSEDILSIKLFTIKHKHVRQCSKYLIKA